MRHVAFLLPLAVIAACAEATGLETPLPVEGPRFTRLAVPGEYASIQAAHDAASSGDTILLQPGIYSGQVTISKAIMLASLYVTTGDESYIGTTILDGGNASYTISIPSGAEDRPTIQGVTIRNSDDGITPRANFNLLNSVITDTSDGVDYEDGSGGLVQFSTFELNGDDGIDLDNSVDVVIQDNIIRNNGDDGIEIRMQSHSGPTLDIVITRNKIHGNGEDGIQLIWYDSPTDRFFEISYNHIYDNVDVGIGMMDRSTTSEDYRAASIPERINVFGNTFANNGYGITGGDNTVVLNNIFLGHPAIAVKNVDGNSELAYNLFFDNGTDNSGSNLNVASSIFANPLLDTNLELSAGSPAIDAGTAFYVWQSQTVLDLPPSAYSGAAPDLGASESSGPTGPPPDPPVPVSPADGATDVGLTPTLSWTGEGDTYSVQVSSDPGFTDIVDAAVVTTTSHTVASGALTHSAAYHWRVNATNANGTGEYSSVRSFTSGAATALPDPPVLVSPSDGATGVPPEVTLEWSGTADDFDVEVATDSEFSTVVFSNSTSSTTVTLPPDALDHSSSYYWHVRGSNTIGTGAFSGPFFFVTAAAPDTEAPSQPLNLVQTAITSTSVDLAWDASADNIAVTEYGLFRDGAEISAVPSPTTSFTDAELQQATSYSYHVTARDAAGNESSASEVLEVTTEAEPAPTVHVGGITMQLRTPGRWNTARAVVLVVDESGAPVSGVDVEAQWSGLATGLDSGTTSSGEVQFDSDRADNSSSGQFVVTVTRITATGFVYDNGANVQTAACIDSAGQICAVGPPPPPDNEPPSAPDPLTATGGEGRVDLDWPDNESDPDWASFSVYRAETVGGPYERIVEGLTASQHTDASVTGGTTYYYVVTALDESGNESADSNEATATPSEPVQPSIHVDDISVEIVRQGRNYFARAVVSVVDELGAVSGVEVVGDWVWNSTDIGAGSGATDGAGVATVDSAKEKAVTGDVFTFTVRDLVLSGYRYQPASNMTSSESATVG